MKNLFIIALLLFATAKPATKPKTTPKKLSPYELAARSNQPPPIFLCSGKTPIEIQNTFMDTYDWLVKKKKENDALLWRIEQLESRLKKLEKAKL